MKLVLFSTDLDFSAHIVAIVVAVICIATPQDRHLSFHNLDRRLKHSREEELLFRIKLRLVHDVILITNQAI